MTAPTPEIDWPLLRAGLALQMRGPWPDGECRVCGWDLDPDEKMCRLGRDGSPDCSMRPYPKTRADAAPRPDCDPAAFVELLVWLFKEDLWPEIDSLKAKFHANVGRRDRGDETAQDPCPMRALTLAASRALLDEDTLRKAGAL